MPRMVTLGLLFIIVPGVGCRRAAKHSVSLEEWISEDDVQSSCRRESAMYKSMAADITRFGCDAVAGCSEVQKDVGSCGLDGGVGDLRSFDLSFETAFASDPSCQDLHLYVATNDNKLPKDPTDWHFSFDFHPDEPSQKWQLSSESQNKARFGKGDAKQSVHEICAIMTGKGGTVD